MIVRERRWSSRHARSYAVGELVAWEYKSNSARGRVRGAGASTTIGNSCNP
jgi:hypothetical protein